MSWITNTLSSSLGRKLLVALTGLFLISFLVVHLAGNLQLLYCDEGEAFNIYAKFMTSNPLIKTISYLLYTSIIVHAVWGLALEFTNRKARPVRYKKVNNQSVWASRNMGVLGTIILVFVAVHMSDFWYEYHWEIEPTVKYENEAGVMVQYKDLYEEVHEAFEVPWIVIFYVLSMVALAYHLGHGFQSAFQTLGLNHKKYTPFIKKFGLAFAIIIPALFALIPIIIFFS